MKETEVERYVSDLLTVSGFRNDGAEHRLWVLLHHLYSAVALWEQATDEERQVVEAMRKKLQYFFSAKIKNLHIYMQVLAKLKRGMRDLNPRTLARLAVFETAPFSRLGNSASA